MKSKLFSVISCVLFLGVIAGVAVADPDLPWTDKWFQRPEMQEPWGKDIESNISLDGNLNVVVMDDWRCNNSEAPVKGFRWWGSYFEGHSINDLVGFQIVIHTDIPEAGTDPSQPGEQLVSNFKPIGDVAFEHSIGFDSYGDEVFEYFVWLDECFWQTEGEVYWVGISAVVQNADPQDPQPVWGWHTGHPDEFTGDGIDDAVQIFDYDVDGAYSNWEELWHEGYGSLNMAFEVIPEPSTLLMVVPGLIGLAAAVLRRKK